MLSVDFHAHTLFSPCGIHTHIEMLTEARKRNLQGLALTDHGPALGGKHPQPVYTRLDQPVAGIRYLKGIEANVKDEAGTLDVPRWMWPRLDVVLVGLHLTFERKQSGSDWTEPLLAALRRHPGVDIVSHPVDPSFPLDMERLAVAAREQGLALELNNSKLLYGRVEAKTIARFLDTCRDAQCLVAVSSDAHALQEIGDDSAARPLLEASGIPDSRVVNATADSAFRFVEDRRRERAAWLASLGE